MPKPGLVDYLERVALDYDFRALAGSDVASSYQGYEISLADQEVLAARDDRMLALLAAVLGTGIGTGTGAGIGTGAGTGGADAGVTSSGQPAPEPTLASTVELLLQLTPMASQDEVGGLVLAHQATLHAMPVADEPLPEPAYADIPGGGVGVNFKLSIEAYAQPEQDGQTRLSYVPRIVGFGDRSPPPQLAHGTSSQLPAGSDDPTEYAPAFESVTALAEMVLSLPDGHRYQGLSQLAAALEQTGGEP